MNTQNFNTAIILAGGKSLRFGRDKAFISFEGRPLIEHILLQLQKEFSEVFIIANEQDKYAPFKVPVVPDLNPGAGPLAGIQAGLAASSSPYVFVMACDMPSLSPGLIAYMKKRLIESPSEAVLMRREEFIEPFHAFYSINLEQKMGAVLRDGQRGVHSFLKTVKYQTVEGDIVRKLCPDGSIFTNINYESDLDRLKK